MPEQVLTVSLPPESLRVLRDLIARCAPSEIARGIFELFDRLGGAIAANIIKTQLSGDPLHRRTGSLARSVVGGAFMTNGVPSIRVGIFRGPALAYANIQEFGGTVRPVNAKALAMPVNDDILARDSTPAHCASSHSTG